MPKLAPALDAALSFAAHGLRAFPLKANSKQPATAHGFKDATLDGGVLHRRFAAAGPDANVGVATGAGLLVVELDSAEMLAWFESNDIPATWVAASGRGGRHFYFRVDRPIPTTPLGPLAGFPNDDGSRLKGEGGYVVAPPSLHPNGTRYAWVNGGPASKTTICAAPAWLIALVGEPRALRMTQEPFDASSVVSTAQDSHGASRAAALAKAGMSRAEAKAALWAMIDGRFAGGRTGLDPSRPWTDRDVDRWLDGAYRKFYDPDAPARAAADEALEARVRTRGEVPTDAELRRNRVSPIVAAQADQLQPIPLTSGDELISVSAADVEARAVRWLWKGRLPAGMLAILDGDPGNGKSSIAADWMAHVTTGREWPDGATCARGGAVYVQAEDPEAEVVVPRLRAAGADLARVRLARHVKTARGERAISLPGDVPLIARLIDEVGARLLVLDPVFSYLDARVNANSDMEVRQALTPLVKMLAATGCACVMLRHLKKDDKVSVAMYRGGGSIAIVALARAGFAVHKMKGQDGALALSPTKMNLAPKPRSISYALDQVVLDGDGIETSRVVWGDAIDADVDAELTAFGADGAKPREVAKEVVMDFLSDGPKASRDLEDAAGRRGVAPATLRRAKEDLHLISRRVDDAWWNALPEHSRELAEVGAVRGPDGRLYAAGGHVETPRPKSEQVEHLISGTEKVSMSGDTGVINQDAHFEGQLVHSSRSDAQLVHFFDIAHAGARAREGCPVCGAEGLAVRRRGRDVCGSCGAYL